MHSVLMLTTPDSSCCATRSALPMSRVKTLETRPYEVSLASLMASSSSLKVLVVALVRCVTDDLQTYRMQRTGPKNSSV